MDSLRRFDTISDYNLFNNNETHHPLVSVVDLSKAAPRQGSRMYFGFYTIFLKDVKCGDLVYGRHTYDYQEGTLVFLAPGQVAGVNSNGETYQPKGYALVFHPDLLLGTSLGRHMQDYTFFGYQSNEALHLSEEERKIVLDCFSKINYELERAIDKHSKRLIVSNIELFLNYCVRFYDRQFIIRDHVNNNILGRFEVLLNEYFQSKESQTAGLPTVAFCAERLHLSANYFGDLVKKETGKTAQEYIQFKLLEAAKERIFDRTKTVNEIAYELGFKYPQHFSRFFKDRTGQTPNEYRTLHSN
ncbi:helix-turn-helix domain-containing protein [Runella slithyformis]|uniref:Transcriptional regulator, AraC family n=1 Tax=Runella slithyformis (strain ATCC 29530 / DSM 19594 / LMG 11500 / NCIMB 11436 / LSU 4) TaxID=761193 RepID=A0A7U3ZLR6_RUNSL|nr:helix-turn-helix domain-containing protein [Runella slithyformis]AEI49550.1 transcriptional regulator, AraC family [Runella slithyformis DSM 19594]